MTPKQLSERREIEWLIVTLEYNWPDIEDALKIICDVGKISKSHYYNTKKKVLKIYNEIKP